MRVPSGVVTVLIAVLHFVEIPLKSSRWLQRWGCVPGSHVDGCQGPFLDRTAGHLKERLMALSALSHVEQVSGVALIREPLGSSSASPSSNALVNPALRDRLPCRVAPSLP